MDTETLAGSDLHEAVREALPTTLGDEYVQIGVDAVECVNAGDWQEMLDLPSGETWEAEKVVRVFRLDRFIDADIDDFEDVEVELDEDDEEL